MTRMDVLVFLWIAFNAAYAQEIPRSVHLSQPEAFTTFCTSCTR